MSPEKRVPIVMTPTKAYQRELAHLYARRTAIDTLIQSLEAYDRFYRVRSVDERKRKTA